MHAGIHHTPPDWTNQADTPPDQADPPGAGDHPPGPGIPPLPLGARDPPGPGRPPRAGDPPGKQTAAYGLRAAGTHPTGMHSCSERFFVCFFDLFRFRSHFFSL